MVRISHVIKSIDLETGGPARSTTHLVNELNNVNPELQITLNTFWSSNPIIENFENDNSINFFDSRNSFCSRDLRHDLINSKYALLHGQGIWELPVHQMSTLARRLGTPYVISTRGMLEPWSLSQKRVKKAVAMFLFQRKDLQLADCIHATANTEAENLRRLGFTNPIAIIPNGINLFDFPDYDKLPRRKRKLLFLSRIHEKKGLELLIGAWKSLDTKYTVNWEIEIVGGGSDEYIRTLKELIMSLGLDSSVIVSKPVYGIEKTRKYQSSDLFVLPSHSENFGIVIAEALACKVPVITTKGAPWSELNKLGCGDWIDIGMEPLKESLKRMLLKTDEELFKMGTIGRNLVIEKYSMNTAAVRMNKMYHWILNKGDRPEYVNIL
jgi:glycosyltransferase involved in cell wall biosynthesis